MRRGQIFLILTILVITFMVGISAVLLDIQRANYFNPSPESSSTLNAWETTVDALEQIIETELAFNSQQGSPDGIALDITTPLANLETYLIGRGLLVDISVVGTITYSSTTTLTSNSISTVAEFNVFLASEHTEISNNLLISIDYTADVSSNLVVITRTDAFRTSFIQNTEFSVAQIIDLGNGAYDTSAVGSVPVTALTPQGVQLSFTTST